MNQTVTRKSKRDVNGILILDKPRGISSNRALQIAKRLYAARKAGHTGSLDPLATGMLPLCFGHATKVSGLLLESDKAYEVRIRFGAKTNTADAEGEIIEECAVQSVEPAILEQLLQGFVGDSEQIPPMYSALKQDGQRLYKLAREGIEVERKPRRIRIHDLRVLDEDPAEPKLFVHCSKGTYIRSLAEDIAAAAGTLGYVTELHRVWVEPFADMPMVTLEQLEALAEQGQTALDQLLTGADMALQHLAGVSFDALNVRRLLQGQVANGAGLAESGADIRMYDDSGDFIGLGQVLSVPEGCLEVAPKRLFVSA